MSIGEDALPELARAGIRWLEVASIMNRSGGPYARLVAVHRYWPPSGHTEIMLAAAGILTIAMRARLSPVETGEQ